MKKIAPLLGLSAFLLLFVVFGATHLKDIRAATDTCTGVQTTFDATYPSNVTQGQAFNLSNITSRPDKSFGVTVTSSTLYLSATNASETAYSKSDTSTDPSPTTGASTYTAYYPDWALTATGSADSQIIIKLVKATAQVTGFGAVTCPLTATLAIINITAPPPDNTSGSPSSGSSATAAPPATTQTTTPTPPTTPQATAPTTAPATQPAVQQPSQQTTKTDAGNQSTGTVSVSVKTSKNHVFKNVKVTLDNAQTNNTAADGTTVFKDIAFGEHHISVQYGKQKIEKAVLISAQQPASSVAIVVTPKSNIMYLLLIAVGSLIIVSTAAFLVIKRLRKPKLPFSASVAQAVVSSTNLSPGQSQPVAMPANATPSTLITPTKPIVPEPSVLEAEHPIVKAPGTPPPEDNSKSISPE